MLMTYMSRLNAQQVHCLGPWSVTATETYARTLVKAAAFLNSQQRSRAAPRHLCPFIGGVQRARRGVIRARIRWPSQMLTRDHC